MFGGILPNGVYKNICINSKQDLFAFHRAIELIAVCYVYFGPA
jgi:hypothetical protein